MNFQDIYISYSYIAILGHSLVRIFVSFFQFIIYQNLKWSHACLVHTKPILNQLACLLCLLKTVSQWDFFDFYYNTVKYYDLCSPVIIHSSYLSGKTENSKITTTTKIQNRITNPNTANTRKKKITYNNVYPFSITKLFSSLRQLLHR